MSEQSPKKRSKTKLVLSILGGLVVICMVCFVIALLLPPSDKASETATPNQAVSEVLEDATDAPAGVEETEPTVAPVAENTEPAPTDAPAPTDTPEPTATPTLAPSGDSRTNPAPAGVAVEIGGEMTMTIISVVRPADAIVKAANSFNTEPEPGQEYIQVEVQVVCNKDASQTCNFNNFELKAVGGDGNIHEAEIFVAGVDNQLENGDFFGGATKAGLLFFIVSEGDTEVVIMWEPLLFGDPVFFALPVPQ